MIILLPAKVEALNSSACNDVMYYCSLEDEEQRTVNWAVHHRLSIRDFMRSMHKYERFENWFDSLSLSFFF